MRLRPLLVLALRRQVEQPMHCHKGLIVKLPTLPKMPIPSRQYFKIGDYYLHYFGGDYWIEHESGEGMQVSKEALEKMIADYYRENF